MEIELAPHAHRQYKKLPPSIRELIHETIKKLETTSFPPGYKKLTARDGYRLRYGDYRIIYSISDKTKTITILAIAHRREIYKI